MNKILCGFFALCAVPSNAREKPNFVVIIADDVSWDDFGCYGNTMVKTPNIDRLARRGIKFTGFFLTASSSSPSRNSIITGRYPHNTGAAELHTEPPEEMVSFPEIMRQNGYYTVQAGKFHLGKYARRGFDIINDNNKLNGYGGEDLWISLLKDRPAGKPFFMWLAAYDAHRPWGTNQFSGTHDPAVISPPLYLADGEKTRKDLAAYYDEIARFDHYVGLVEKELEWQKVLENTVIMVLADNGRPFPHSKTRVNDRGMKTPFILHWPGGRGKRQKECSSLVSAVDIAPTILELASIQIPEFFQGYSFARLVKNPSGKFRNYVYAEHNWHDYEAHERMLRSREFLYILNSRPEFPNLGPADVLSGQSYIELRELYERGRLTPAQAEIFLEPRLREEFYDCKKDPHQLNNIIRDKKYRKNTVMLRMALIEWMEKTADNVPEDLTKDWYIRGPGNKKTENHGIRGEPVDRKFDAIKNNNKGKF
jgi:arylsulfatase A-like enzyme